jgi:hypothetical protein
MNQQKARTLAYKYLQSIIDVKTWPFEILDSQTIAKSYGWIFFYQSMQYLKTGFLSDMLVGNGPILVEKSGKIIQFSTALPIEESLRRYEAGLPLLPKSNSRLPE